MNLLSKSIVLAMVLIVLVLVADSPAFSSEIYYAQSSTGSNNGSSCTNAYSLSDSAHGINTPSVWTAGNTLHLCGTITAAPGAWVIASQGNGTSSSPITIKWESGAILQAPYFSSNGAINVSKSSYIVIDGGTNGILQNTLNGTKGGTCSGGACSYQQNSQAINASGATNLTVQNLTIANIYVHSLASDTSIDQTQVVGIYDNGTATNWTIRNDTMHDIGWATNVQFGSGSSNLTFSGNNIYNVDHGIAVGGPSATGSLNGLYVYGNNIHDYANWDTGSADAYHHDGIHVWGYNDNGSNTIQGIQIYNNTFGGCIGADVTAHIFVEANQGGTKATYIYNNTLIDTCSGVDNDGLLTTGSPDGPYYIYNNTFMGSSSDVCVGTSSSPNVTFINNVVTGCGTLISVTTAGGFTSGGLNNNIYSAGGSNAFTYHGNYWNTSQFSKWQSATGQDSNSSYTSSAGLSSNGSPASTSPVVATGKNLASLNIKALDSDIINIARPVTGLWTVGAYALTGITPPQNLTVVKAQ